MFHSHFQVSFCSQHEDNLSATKNLSFPMESQTQSDDEIQVRTLMNWDAS
jgi:hypothetical protein